MTPIIQFGTSRFLQAHADFFISQAMARGEALGPVTIVKTSADAGRESRLTGLADPAGYPVEIKGLDHGKVINETVMVTSVKRALSAQRDWAELKRIMVEEAKLVISNTAEAGFVLDSEEATAPAGPSNSFPGKLVQLLKARFDGGGEPLTIIPTELISRNGDVLASLLGDLARQWYGHPGFSDWLDNKVIIANSLVDRIVSRALEPAGAVCEPYALWAIENKAGMVLPCKHPAIVVADDISSYERLKLFILNLGHTILVDQWLTRGLPEAMVVREILADEPSRHALQEIYDNEIIPGFAGKGMERQARDYVSATLERFANPFLDHYLRDIHQHHAEKIRRRAGGFLDWAGHENRPRLHALLAKA